jgi:hypothetical protein
MALDTTAPTVGNDLDYVRQNPQLVDLTHPLTFDEATALGDAKDDEAPWLKWGNVWYFTKLNTDFGAKWPGRIPGQIVPYN